MSQNSHAGSHSDKHHGNHEDTHHDPHHVIEFSTYIRIFVALLVLTVITVAASRFDFGEWNTVIAFAIATVKAFLVLAYFMHLKYDNMLNRVAVVCAVFFLIVLYFFCLIDDLTRVIQHSVL